MSASLVEFRYPRERRADVAFRVAAALSLLVHALVLWGFPRMRLPSLELSEWNDPNRSLSVRLVPPTPPPVPPSAQQRTRPAPASKAQPPRATPEPSAPPVIALKPPAPNVRPPAPAHPTAEGDLWSYIEAKRRARAEPPPSAPVESAPPAPPPEDEGARRDRVAAANLAPPGGQVFGYDPKKRGGGAFQLQRVGLDDAEFIFYGWDREARRNMARLIEVRRGSNNDIRIAVVRRMIVIIRDFEQGDFLWESTRLGRSVTLSARPRDNAALEDFLMEEFFTGGRPLR